MIYSTFSLISLHLFLKNDRYLFSLDEFIFLTAAPITERIPSW